MANIKINNDFFNRNKSHIINGTILAIGFIFFVSLIFNNNVWYDESFTTSIVKHTYTEIWNITAKDVHPPLYYYIVKGISQIFNYNLVVMRFCSIAGALALVILGLFPIKRLFGKKCSIIFSILAIFMPVMLNTGLEIRMYSWATVFVTASAIYAYSVIVDCKLSYWIKFAIFSIAGAYTHYYALLGIAIIYLFLLIWLIFKDRKQLVNYFIFATITVLAYLPWLFNMISQVSSVSKGYWILAPTIKEIEYYAFYPFQGRLGRGDCKLLLIVTACLLIWGIGITLHKKIVKGYVAIISLSIFILTILTGIIISYLVKPVFVERYMIPEIGLLLLAISYFLSTVKKKSIIGVYIFILLVTSFGNYRSNYNRMYDNDGVNAMISYIKENTNTDTLFLHASVESAGVLGYYLPKNRQLVVNVSKPYLKSAQGMFMNELYAYDFKPYLNKAGEVNINQLPGHDKVIFLIDYSGNNFLKWVNSGKFEIIKGKKSFKVNYDSAIYNIYLVRYKGK